MGLGTYSCLTEFSEPEQLLAHPHIGRAVYRSVVTGALSKLERISDPARRRASKRLGKADSLLCGALDARGAA